MTIATKLSESLCQCFVTGDKKVMIDSSVNKSEV